MVIIIKIKYVLLVLVVLFLTGCEDKEYVDEVVEDIQIEMSKEFDVAISDIEVEVIECDIWKYTIDKFLINIEGNEKTYMYIGNTVNGYELLIYEE